MHHKLTKRQKVICGIIMFSVVLLYVCACAAVLNMAWLGKDGDTPPASPRLLNFCFDVVTFPFGFIPGVNGAWVTILDALLWSTLSGFIYVRFCRRKVAA